MSQPRVTPRATGTGRVILAVSLLAFVLGAVLVGWVAWRSGLTLDRVIGREPPRLATSAASRTASSPTNPATPAPLAANQAVAQGALDQRIGALEQRLARLDLQAEAVSGNTARAEALLIAFAARRMIDRGVPLGYLEDQLKVRFADAQPNAVATIVGAAARPITLDRLAAQLQAMAPALARAPREESGWSRIRDEVSSLFVIRSEARDEQDSSVHIDRALLKLRAGRIDDAVTEVRRLPGAATAANWIGAAQRYQQTQRALDLIESTALIEPRRLSDGVGQNIEAPSPLVTPPLVTPLQVTPAPTAPSA
ncbi:MAG: hypothetical protein ABIQ81_05950 [Novosphingobium sp.]